MSEQRPKFLRSAIDEVGKETDIVGWPALVPYALGICVIISASVSWLVPEILWSKEKLELVVALYVGLLTFDGLILALGWSAFSRIYDVLLRADFGKYLMKNNLLNGYIVHITYMHIFQIAAVMFAAIGLVFVLIEQIPVTAQRLIFAATLSFTMYALKQAVSAVTAMNDLVWQAAYFEANKPQPNTQGNVVSVFGDRT